MKSTYFSKPLKKPANLSINSDLLAKAKALKINLSATFEIALAEKIKEKERELWRNENAQAIRAYNNFVDKNGVFSDDFRSF